MAQSDSAIILAGAGATVKYRCHVCAFFNSREHEYREHEYEALVPFLKEGLDAGRQAIHILDKNHRAERKRRLMRSGINVSGIEKSNRQGSLSDIGASIGSGRHAVGREAL